MKTIVVPTTCTPGAYHVAEYAAGFARAVGASIHCIHVYSMKPAVIDESVGWNYFACLQEQHEKKVNDLVAFLQKKYAIEVSGEAGQGFPGDFIAKRAEELEAGLIIMGIRTTRHNRLAGSTGLKVVRKSNIPVLIVPAAYSFKPLRNIILAIDCKETLHSETFDLLSIIIKRTGAALQVVHIAKRECGNDPAGVHTQLDTSLSKLPYLYTKIEHDDIAQGIHDAVESNPVDCLVLVAHHHNLLQRIFGEVTTRYVSFNINLPLLVLKNVML